MIISSNIHLWKRPNELSVCHSPTRHVTPRSLWKVGVFVFPLPLVLPSFCRNGNIIWLMPPYETFTAFWMLSTFLLNWMFANKSHGAGGWHDSLSSSLWVILPRSTQGKQICIPSMTNLAVCFHCTGVHIIYFYPFCFLFPSLFNSPLSSSISLRTYQCVILQSFLIFIFSLKDFFSISVWKLKQK